MRKTILALAVQVALCANLASQQLYYTVKFPDDQTIVAVSYTHLTLPTSDLV